MHPELERILILILDFFYRIYRVILHYVLAIAYWSRSRVVPPITNPLLKMSATELAKEIREGKLSSKSVVQAFIDRIVEVEPYINATVEHRFQDALEEAKEADDLVASGTMTTKELEKETPLLGVPFSVKVLLTVKGLRSTGGSLLFKDIRAFEDAATVKLMKKAGAIVLVTTNSPEGGISFETNNYAHGITCNPYDTSRTSGGSSGGESALIAAAGSVIGLGNDLAGSIRIPSLFTGIFGHKPSSGLVSNDGCFPVPTEDLDPMLSTGPMCRYAEDLVTAMRILASPKGNFQKFGEKVNFKDMKVYYMLSFGDMKMTEKVDADMQNAIKKVAFHFEMKYGSKVREISFPRLKRSFNIYMHALISAVPNIAECITAGKTKLNGAQELLKFLFRQSKITIGYVIALNARNIPLLYNEEKVKHYRRMANEIDAEISNLLDDRSVLILPTMPFPAPYHYEIPLLIGSTCYSHIINVLGLPSTQCPVGFNSRGLPIGVQIVGRKDNDYFTIACVLEVEKAFGGWIPPK